MVPEDLNDQTEIISDVTPLKAMAYELNEVYLALREADFSERVAALIISSYMAEIMSQTLADDGETPDDDLDEDDWEEDPEAGSAD